jgi:hypothetical protein
MYEHRREALLPRQKFWLRILRHGFLAAAIITGALGIGILGYHYCEQLGWLDAFVNAAMILSGMGPLAPLQYDAGKWFAGFYALFSGVAFITIVGVIFAPVVHRFLHKFHLDSHSK